MLANKSKFFRLEQRSVIKSLVAEKYNLIEIYCRICDMYGQICSI